MSVAVMQRAVITQSTRRVPSPAGRSVWDYGGHPMANFCLQIQYLQHLPQSKQPSSLHTQSLAATWQSPPHSYRRAGRRWGRTQEPGLRKCPSPPKPQKRSRTSPTIPPPNRTHLSPPSWEPEFPGGTPGLCFITIRPTSPCPMLSPAQCLTPVLPGSFWEAVCRP
jgi:hypothetical protein